jgi:hypothetical protein
MLKELPSSESTPGRRRRWFSDPFWDLIVWSEDDGSISGFQLCYQVDGEQRALTWTSKGGYSHDRIDEGEGNPSKNQTPILVPSADTLPAEDILEGFSRDAADLDPLIRDFVIERIRALAACD